MRVVSQGSMAHLALLGNLMGLVSRVLCSLWASQYNRDMDIPETVQRRTRRAQSISALRKG